MAVIAPVVLTPDDVLLAARRLGGAVVETPTVWLPGDRVGLHLEFLQFGGTVKYRGALNTVLAAQERGPVRRITAASGGNAAVAAAVVARRLGLPALVYVPAAIPTEKVVRLTRLGATVILSGDEYADAYDAAVAVEGEPGDVFVHAFEGIDMAAGEGTAALDLRGRFDTLLVAVGGGGVLAGMLAGLRAADRGSVRVVAVETEGCASFAAALEVGEPVDVAVRGVAVDSLGARRVGLVPFATATRYGVESVQVTDEAVIAAREEILAERRLLIEHGSAAAYAAITSGAYRPAPGERVLVLLCAANTSRD
jgi:threonine dehydratase